MKHLTPSIPPACCRQALLAGEGKYEKFKIISVLHVG